MCDGTETAGAINLKTHSTKLFLLKDELRNKQVTKSNLTDVINPFHATGLFQYPQKTSENQAYAVTETMIILLNY